MRGHIGHVQQRSGYAVSPSVYATLYEKYGQELSELLELILNGEVVSDRVTAERLVRSVGALLQLHGKHRLDSRGRCAVCWSAPRTWWRLWRKRSACTVHTTLRFHMRQPERFIWAALGDSSSGIVS
jgi:hypothetical protein